MSQRPVRSATAAKVRNPPKLQIEKKVWVLPGHPGMGVIRTPGHRDLKRLTSVEIWVVVVIFLLINSKRWG